MQRLIPEIRHPGTVLLVGSLSLSVGILTAMLSVGEPERREAVAMLPPPGLRSYVVARMPGDEPSYAWEISEAQLGMVRAIDGVVAATADGRSGGHMVKHGRKHAQTVLIGIDQYYRQVEDMACGMIDSGLTGRRVQAEDIATHARVCVLPRFEAAELGVEAEGAAIRIDGYPFQVIGIWDVNYAEIPATTYKSLFGKEFILSVVVAPPIGDEPDHSASLRELSALKPQSDPRLEAHLQRIFETSDRFLFDDSKYRLSLGLCREAVRQLLTFGLIGAVPLAVTFFGALGIAAVWVRDRMWSYALLRALGATRSQVAVGALLEPLAIACIGAVAGLACGWLLCWALHTTTGLGVAYNWRWFGAAAASGLAAMLVPALYVGLRAAFTAPAEALRT